MSGPRRAENGAPGPSAGARWRAGRGFALVPRDDGGSRALAAVVAILAFLAALAAGAAEIVAASSAEWRSTLLREATIQVRPGPGRNAEAGVAEAVDLARGTPGVLAADVISAAEAERLLEPWLGAGLDLSDLPVPRLVVLRLDLAVAPDLDGLRARLAAVPGASLDAHDAALSRLSTMATTVVLVAAALVALVLAASGLAVAFATRGAVAASLPVVEVLHLVGATDAFIAREFARRFARLAMLGGLVGAGGAMALVVGGGALAASLGSGPAGAQIEALFGSFTLGPRGLAAIGLVPIAEAAIAAFVSVAAVKRFLRVSG